MTRAARYYGGAKYCLMEARYAADAAEALEWILKAYEWREAARSARRNP